jgi:ligand-binding sensor domain-containing protein/two-component sensor histidine kinase
MGAATGNDNVRRIGLRWLGLALAALGVTICTRGAAAEHNLSVNDFQVTTYTERDGAPTNTWVMAQTPDGWLWFGGPNGLYRFDGIRFEEVKVDSGDSTHSTAVSVLYALPSGKLVIGKARGGVSILEHGELTHYDSEETRRAGRVMDLAQDAEGAIWAAAANGLMRFDGHQWQLVGKEWGFPGGLTYAVMMDRHGTLWVSTETKVLFLERGRHNFDTTNFDVDRGWAFLQSPDGKTWVADVNRLRLLPGQTLMTARVPTANSPPSNTAFFDREGYFWYLNEKPDGGWWPEPAIAGVGSLDKGATTGFQDRDGNIWIGTSGAAIYRLHRPAVETVRIISTTSTALVADTSGRVWIGFPDIATGTKYEGVWMYDTSLRQVQPDEIKLVTAIAREPGGTIWLGARAGLWRRRADRFEPAVALPEPVRGQRIKGISPDCADGLWVSVPPLGLLRYDGTNWRVNGDIPGLPAEMPNVQACDAAGQLWLGYANGKVARVTKGNANVFDAGDGLRVGAVTALGIGPTHTMVAGDRGMAMLQNSHFVTIESTNPRIFEKVSGIVETPSGDIWTNNPLGIAHTKASELNAYGVSAGTAPIPVELFDSGDGYPGPGFTVPDSGPSAVIASDGRIWFAAGQGIAWIDPARVLRKPGKPPVVIQALSSDGERLDRFDGTRFSKGTRSIRVDYTALNYSHPERLRFRYRLDGIDAHWVDAGARREAAYANLGPGHYRFFVNVTNENGVWTDSSAAVNFDIPPTFIQTRIFLGLCIAATLGVLVLFYNGRVRQLTARERLLVESRLKERERIARELHDTLLQGTQALILMVHGAAARARRGEPVHEALDEALARADDVMAEGRDRIQHLRLADGAGEDIAASLTAAGETMARGGSVRFHVAVEGPARVMASDSLHAADRIGREAMLNAFRHAKPTSVEVQLIFSDENFRLRVRDDGVGIDERVFESGSRQGHWGLPGMRERAQGIGAELEVWSRPGAGTEVELQVPAAVAYRRQRAMPRWGWFGRIAGVRPK